MEKARKFKEVALNVLKLDVKQEEDWSSLATEELPNGLYLGETPAGEMCVFYLGVGGYRCGMWLPPKEIVKINVEQEQNALVSELSKLELKLTQIELKLKQIENHVSNNNNLIADVADEKAEPIIQSLINIEKQIKEIPKQTEGQKSSLTEMGEVVVNIIKATK